MKIGSIRSVAVALMSLAAVQAASQKAPTVNFARTEYLHRWSQADQHEYTPAGQEDLEHWSDMVTVNYYRKVTEGEGLAATANAVLTNYRNHRAMIVRTDSVPRTPQSPAEYLMVVLFPQPQFIEAVFNRFKIVNGTGVSVAYSHRIYGKKIGSEMSAWLQANGPKMEKSLMALAEIPPLEAVAVNQLSGPTTVPRAPTAGASSDGRRAQRAGDRAAGSRGSP